MAAAPFGWCLDTIMHASSQSRTWYNDLTPVLTLSFFWHYKISFTLRHWQSSWFFFLQHFFFWHCNFLLTLPQFLLLQHVCRIMTHIWHCIMFMTLQDSFEAAIYLFGILVYCCNMILAFQHYLRLCDSFDIATFCHTLYLQLSFGNNFCYQILLILWLF